MPTSTETKRRVLCPGCGDVRWLTARNARGIERGEMTGLCVRCRYPGRPATPEDRALAMRWWLDRFTDAEIAGFALALGVDGASPKHVAARRA